MLQDQARVAPGTDQTAEEKIRRVGWTVVEECWIWNASCTRVGYPQMRWDGTMVAVHRLSYLIWNGPIEQGLVVRHTCDVPACINPAHLTLGTRRDNGIDWTQRNDQAGQKKLSNADVITIRRLAAAGARTVDLAGQFGVGETYISSIRNGRTRQWV